MTGIVFLIFGWLCLALGGAGIVFSPESQYAPAWLGWCMVGVSLGIAAVTVDRWAKVLPGLVCYGAIGAGLGAMSGRISGLVPIPIGRGEALMMALSLLGCALVAASIASRRLTRTDRVAMMGVIIAFVAGIGDRNLALVSSGLMFLCMAIAWGIDWIASRRGGRAREQTGRVGSGAV